MRPPCCWTQTQPIRPPMRIWLYRSGVRPDRSGLCHRDSDRLDEDAGTASEKLRLVERVIEGCDFTCIPEMANAIEASPKSTLTVFRVLA